MSILVPCASSRVEMGSSVAVFIVVRCNGPRNACQSTPVVTLTSGALSGAPVSGARTAGQRTAGLRYAWTRGAPASPASPSGTACRLLLADH